MKLTKKQFCTYVKKYEQMLEQNEQILDSLNINPEWLFSSWLNSYYEMLSDLCELPISVTGTLLDWFCFDVDFGRNEIMSKVVNKNGCHSTIRTPEDLYDYIIENNIKITN